MKRILHIIVIAFLFAACGSDKEEHPYNNLNIDAINKELAAIDITDDKDDLLPVVTEFFNFNMSEGKRMVISKKLFGSQTVTITLSGLKDDSVEAEKMKITGSYEDGHWVLESVQTAVRCYEGRGHTDWGIEKCK